MKRTKITPELELKVIELKKEKLLYKDIAKNMGISKTSVENILAKHKLSYYITYIKEQRYCLQCTNSFEVYPKDKKKFCSQSCSCKYTNKLTKTQNKLYFCKKCGNLTTKRRKLCDSCKNKPLYSILREAIYDNVHRAAAFAYVRTQSRIWLLNNREHICEYCGYNKAVQGSHIKPISSYDLDTPISVINDSENLLLLCPNHHWENEHLELTLEEIKNSEFYHKNRKK